MNFGKNNGGSQDDIAARLSQGVRKAYGEGACPNCYKPLKQAPHEQFTYTSQFSHTVVGKPNGIAPQESSVSLWRMERECAPCGYRDRWASDGKTWYPINSSDEAGLFSPSHVEHISTLKQYWDFVKARTPEDVVRGIVADFFNGRK